MKKVTLFIAMSLDGYIADKAGGVDWLQGQSPEADDMASYNEFIQDIDTVILGWNTYHQLVTELSPDKWMYSCLTSYVLTHRSLPERPNIHFVNSDVCHLIRNLRQHTGKGIWICGGAGIIQPLVHHNLIDRYHISIIPTILGEGIRLFQPADSGIRLKLVGTKSYNGITDLIYEPKEE